MINKAWQGDVQFFELAFGTWIAYLFLVFFWEKVLKINQDGWRYSLTTLLGASFFIINHYFLRAPFYRPLINFYTIIFFILYYFILVHHLNLSIRKKITAFLTNILFTAVYILAENVARFSVNGRLIPGVYIPEFLFLLISFLACTGIILSYRKKA